MTPTENTAPGDVVASVGNGMTAGKYRRTAGKRGASGYEPAGKSNPIATGLKAA